MSAFSVTNKFLPKDQEKIMKMLLPGERHGRYEGRKEGRKEGLQEGRLEMLREDILDILEMRFQNVSYSLREKIRTISEDKRLRELHRHAVVAESLEAFAARL